MTAPLDFTLGERYNRSMLEFLQAIIDFIRDSWTLSEPDDAGDNW